MKSSFICLGIVSVLVLISAHAAPGDYVGEYKTSHCSEIRVSTSQTDSPYDLPAWDGSVFKLAENAGSIKLTDDKHQGWFDVSFSHINQGPVSLNRTNGGLSGTLSVDTKERAHGLYQLKTLVVGDLIFKTETTLEKKVPGVLQLEIHETNILQAAGQENEHSSRGCLLTKIP